jgi:hypothetical protein
MFRPTGIFMSCRRNLQSVPAKVATILHICEINAAASMAFDLAVNTEETEHV